MGNIYINEDLQSAITKQAKRDGVKTKDLVKSLLSIALALEKDSASKDNLKLVEAIANLSGRVQNLELILQQYCVLTEAQLEDIGYCRGALEVQASLKSQVDKSAKLQEQKRSQLAERVKSEINKYLK